ncbi:MAG: aldo/keto reductase [Ignavibacteriaceae bacterium]
MTQVPIAWVLTQPAITSAIVGASKPGQLEDSLKSVDMKLDNEEMEFLNSLWYDLPRVSDPKIALR